MTIKKVLISKGVLFQLFLAIFVLTLVSCAPAGGGYQRVEEPIPPEAEAPPPPSDEPVYSETASELKIQLDGDILFDYDRSTIRPKAESILQEVAGVINRYQNPDILIEGYTDSKGRDDYNLDLSDRRALAVKDWLIKKGKVAGRIVTRGWGEAKSIAPNENPDGSDNPEGRQQNRRVEITVKKETFSPQ